MKIIIINQFVNQNFNSPQKQNFNNIILEVLIQNFRPRRKLKDVSSCVRNSIFIFFHINHLSRVQLLQPHRLQPARLLYPWDFPGKNTGVGCHFLLQGIFPIQGSNLGLPHCRQILYQLSHQGNPLRVLTSVRGGCYLIIHSQQVC